MTSFDDLKKNLPPQTQVIFDAFWEALPLPDRKNFLDLVQAFPSETNLLQLLFKLGSKQLKMTFGNKTSIAIVGPANVGKSTLYNRFIQQKEDRADVSPLPGTTRSVQEADAGIFTVVDTPGADAIGDVGEKERQSALDAASRADVSPLPGTTRSVQEADAGIFTVVDTPGADAIGDVGEKERQSALDAAASADFLIIVFDAIQGIKITELELYERLKELRKPYLVVLNKSDLVHRDLDDIVEYSAKTLNLAVDQILPVSAKTGNQISDLLRMIAVTEPAIVASLGKALPQYRWQLAWRSIASAASVSAAIALTPLPVIDFIPLVVTQSVMVLGVARIYSYKITAKRARELVVSFGLGFLGRTLFYELSKFGGLPGWLLAAAISVSTTVVMGYAAVLWFERGERLTNDSIRKLSKELTQTFLENLKSLGKKKPGQKGMKKAVEDMLEKSPLSEDRGLIDEEFSEILLEEDNNNQGSA